MTSAAERLTAKTRRTRSQGNKSFSLLRTSFVSFVFFVVNDPCDQVLSFRPVRNSGKLREKSFRRIFLSHRHLPR